MKHSSKIAFLSIFAAVLIVGAASAAYINSHYPMSSKADGLNIPQTARLPKDLTVQEILRISDKVQIVSAFSPLEDGIFTTNLSLWRVDSSKDTVEKIHEFKSGVPAGLTTKIEFDYTNKTYLYTIDESWEGIDIVQSIAFDRDGKTISITTKP